MTDGRTQRLVALLLAQLPEDGSNIGNGALFDKLTAQATAAGLTCSEDDFHEARERLLAAGQIRKGKGRGGSSARVLSAAERRPDPIATVNTDDDRPAFALQGEVVTAELPFTAPPPRKPAAKPTAAAPGDPQVLSYRHPDRRVNNPEVGLVNEASDPERPKTVWAYDPHLDPVLNFDSARAKAEKLIEDALAGDDPAAMRAALQELRRLGQPYLQWTGKAERTSFEVDTVSLHVHERIDPMSILSAVSRARDARVGKDGKKRAGGIQPGLFEAPFESLPLRDAVDFYRHDKGWSNRLIAGDSLLVMNSLLQKESMAGQVQMIYIDPPYGIKYGSNFQPFTNKRDVKDRADADLTQEPEMIKAFRDTWELGIHSYLTYLRDRLLLARDLLTDSGSVFVQIGDENTHLVRAMLDEVFGRENFVDQIVFQTSSGRVSDGLDGVYDVILWYARDHKITKFRKLRKPRSAQQLDTAYTYLQLIDGRYRPMTKAEREGNGDLPKGARRFRPGQTQSQSGGDTSRFSLSYQGQVFDPPAIGGWRTSEQGFERASRASRLMARGTSIAYRLCDDDNPHVQMSNVWTDTVFVSFGSDKAYVVQTNPLVIERCIQMATDPGDLVLDPTCGSGTTAFVAEKWGRRWITCDTSRVAITLAKQRLMTASFDYFELRYPHEGLKGGFIYKTVPHVTLKSIANNPEIDSIHERLHPAVETALAALNANLRTHRPSLPITVAEGARKGQPLTLGVKGAELQEWEVPFPGDGATLPAGWANALREPFEAFHIARQRLQAAMDASIAANADSETLYDKPEPAKNKLRITGPFSVEAVPFPTVLNLDATATPQTGAEFTADAAVARSGATSRHAQWRDELTKTGIRGKAGQMLRFTALETLAGTTCLHCSGTLDTGERAVLSFGPEHGALEQRQVEHAIGEAGELFPRPKMIVFCAFTFDPEAAKDIDAFKGITALKAQMNTDLLTEDLKKARASNQSFWLMGQPDVQLRPAKGGLWQVEVNGFDYFDTSKGELVSGGKARIAMWSLDTDYDGRSLFPHQVFFPMAGKDEGWGKLKKDIRAELDEDKMAAFRGTVSLPFEAGVQRRVAVKIVDDRGIESLKIIALGGVAS
jgi:adenine-specific DNA-methyltransferase